MEEKAVTDGGQFIYLLLCPGNELVCSFIDHLAMCEDNFAACVKSLVTYAMPIKRDG